MRDAGEKSVTTILKKPKVAGKLKLPCATACPGPERGGGLVGHPRETSGMEINSGANTQ